MEKQPWYSCFGYLKKKLGGAMKKKGPDPLRVVMALLAVFMIAFPVWKFFSSLTHGVILISVSLFAMFVAGIMAAFLASRKDVWR